MPISRRAIWIRFASIAIVPALIVLVIYELFLSHRHDYTGHYLAGFGAMLGVAIFWLKQLSAEQYARWSTIALCPMCIVAILLGAVAEATAFRIAKFDEVDFCNQSLGAALAMIVSVAFAGKLKPPDALFDFGIVVAIAFLSAGACFAIA